MDEFEKKLASQQVRTIPGHWEAGILAAAKATHTKPSFWAELFVNLRWGWTTLAAVWLFLLVVNLKSQSASEISVARNEQRQPVQSMAQMRRDLNQMLAFERNEKPDAFLRPRSETNPSNIKILIAHA